MDSAFALRMKQRLHEIQNEQRHVRAALRSGLDVSMTESVGELSAYDNHTSDLGTEMLERGKDLGFIDRCDEVLAMCDNALQKIADGTYGTCDQCGTDIGSARLDALPYAQMCIACQEQSEETLSDRRPVEEDVLYPPFSAKVYYGEDGIDRDDAWEIVARHGTSNAPQDTPAVFDDDDDLTEKGNG